MQKVKSFMKNLWSDESAQGTAEYVLLLVVVVAVVVLFRGRIKSALEGKINEAGDQITGFGG